MDTVPVEKIKEFEDALGDYTEVNAKDFYKDITEKKMWTDESEASLKSAIESFVKTFK
jgi:F0F1-type ATP synthase alpha subunit